YFFFQAEDGIRDFHVTGVQTCALPIFAAAHAGHHGWHVHPGGQRALRDAAESHCRVLAAGYRATSQPGAERHGASSARRALANRSEERRVGTESSSRWSANGETNRTVE